MYEHHRQSIENLIEYFKQEPGIIAVILGGSVAKGCERPDSDLDALVVTTDEHYAWLERENRLTECIHGHCTYEKGYFDVKYCTVDYLKELAERGSEPSRNAYLSSKCLYTIDPEIHGLIEKIPVFQKAEKQEKMLSFYSAFSLNFGYFWNSSEGNPYLKTRVVADIVLYGLRLLLEENEVLYPCHKALVQTVAKLENKPEGLMEKLDAFLSNPVERTKNDFVNSILGFIEYKPPADYAEVLTRYTDDNELWWYKHRPSIVEW